jgi:hypothetical protein
MAEGWHGLAFEARPAVMEIFRSEILGMKMLGGGEHLSRFG